MEQDEGFIRKLSALNGGYWNRVWSTPSFEADLRVPIPYHKKLNLTRSGAQKMEGVLDSCFLISGGIGSSIWQGHWKKSSSHKLIHFRATKIPRHRDHVYSGAINQIIDERGKCTSPAPSFKRQENYATSRRASPRGRL